MNEHYTCIIVDDEPPAIELLTEQLSVLFKNLEILASCSDWEEALDTLREKSADLLFMDISMPGKTSIDLLKLLPQLGSEIIFITAHEQYAVEAFKFNASGYLLKPVTDTDLSLAVNKAIARVQDKKAARNKETAAPPPPPGKSDKIGIPNKQGIDYVNMQDIIYLESVNKCTKIVTTTKQYTSLSPLIKFKTMLEGHSFVQVHRSFIININSISRYETSGLVTLSNKQEIPVARSFKNDFLQHFNKTL